MIRKKISILFLEFTVSNQKYEIGSVHAILWLHRLHFTPSCTRSSKQSVSVAVYVLHAVDSTISPIWKKIIVFQRTFDFYTFASSTQNEDVMIQIHSNAISIAKEKHYSVMVLICIIGGEEVWSAISCGATHISHTDTHIKSTQIDIKYVLVVICSD